MRPRLSLPYCSGSVSSCSSTPPEQEPESRFLSPRILTDLLRKPRWLIGIACMVSGYLLAAWSIGHLELTLVEPLLTTYLLFALILAVPMSKQAMHWTEVAGALILCVGVALLSLSRSTKPIGLSFGSFSHWPAAAIIAGIAFVSVQIGLRHAEPRARHPDRPGGGPGLGIQDALTRQTLEILQGHPITVLLTTWPPYCLLAAGIVGLWLMQNAFSAGPLHASLPTIAAGEPVAGIVLGIVVFGDRIQISPGHARDRGRRHRRADRRRGAWWRARRPSAGCARSPTSSRPTPRPPKPPPAARTIPPSGATN